MKKGRKKKGKVMVRVYNRVRISVSMVLAWKKGRLGLGLGLWVVWFLAWKKGRVRVSMVLAWKKWHG